MNFNKYQKEGWTAYHWAWYFKNHRGHADYVNNLVELLPTKGTVIDFGCGDGLISYKLAERGLKVTGVDNNADAITQGKEMLKTVDCKYDVELVVCDVMDVVGKYNHAMCSAVIEHLDNPVEFLDKVRSVTKGKVILTTDDGGETKKGEYDKNIWNTSELVSMCEDAGFEVNNIQTGDKLICLQLN